MKATATVKCIKCGKEMEITKTVRSSSEAASWVSYMETRAKMICEDCTEARGREQDAAAGLPELTGSDKQIAWALRIRRERLAAIDEYIEAEDTRARRAGFAGADKQRKMFNRIREIIAGQTEARWWIDRRDEITGIIVREVARVHKDELMAIE